MADYLSRAFRVQLTTAMETVIRTAVFEITQIFENSLHDHQVELAQKGEEIAQLKLKLQRAEIRLSEVLCDSEMTKNRTHENQKVSAETLTSPEQPSAAPEIDFEVPDDWCVPLGSENVTKQDGFCPSVRLRQFSIPLCPISIPKIKQEKAYLNIEEPRPKKPGRKPRKVTALDETSARTKDKRFRKMVRRSQRGTVPVNNEVKNLLMDIKQEYSNFKMEPLTRRSCNNLTGKEQENFKIKKRTDKTLDNAAGMTYPCKFCSKVFDRVLGLSVHIRSHKKCEGCKRVFPFPSSLQKHKTTCPKYNKLMAVKSSNPQPSESIAKEKSPSIKQVISEKDKPSWKQSTRFVKMHTRKLTCTQCMKTFSLNAHLKKHTCISTGVQTFTCKMCPKKFISEKALKVHVTKMHKDSIEKNLDLSWTKPLEEMEDCQEKVLSSGESRKKASKINVSQKHKRLKKKTWKSVAEKCAEGFTDHKSYPGGHKRREHIHEKKLLHVHLVRQLPKNPNIKITS